MTSDRMQVGGDQPVEWAPIPFAPDYFVSRCGQVASMKPFRRFAPLPEAPRPLTFGHDKDGYRRVTLYDGRKASYWRVCRLVCWVFNGPPADGQLVRHLDGVNTNDVPENLAWGTAQDNSTDSLNHGTRVRGSAVNTSKLSANQVHAIRQSPKSHTELAQELGVTPCAIWHIRKRRVWKHV
jgi:hypothetical protein